MQSSPFGRSWRFVPALSLSAVSCSCKSLWTGIGQPLALLLKQSSVITELALFDIVPVVKGVAVDISHISTPSTVTGYTKDDGGLEKALQNDDVVVIPAGVPRKVSRCGRRSISDILIKRTEQPGMTRDDLFKVCP